MNISNELKIGITVVVALIVAYVGFKILEDSPIFGQSAIMHTYYQQVDGLTEGTPVFAQGVRVGSVRTITLLGLDSVRVDFGITGSFRPRDGAVAVLVSTDVLGTRAITIRQSEMTRTVTEEGFIRGIYDAGFAEQVSSYAQEIIPGITESTGNLSSVLAQVDDLLRESARDDLQVLFAELRETAQGTNRMIADRNKDLEAGLASLSNILNTLDTLSSERKSDIDAIILNLEQTSAELIELSTELTSISKELNTILAAINSAEGTVGKLIYDPSLYTNIDSLVFNLNETITLLNENPRHFLRHLRLVRLF